jgi:hypothetical protein
MAHHAERAGEVKAVASPVEVQQWVLEDLAATITWLEQQNKKPEENELKTSRLNGWWSV